MNQEILAKILELQEEIELEKLVLDLSDLEPWKALVRLMTRRHNNLLSDIAKRSSTLDDVRYLQGRLKELTMILMAPDYIRSDIQRRVGALEFLRSKFKNVDSQPSNGIFNPDPDIEALSRERST